MRGNGHSRGLSTVNDLPETFRRALSESRDAQAEYGLIIHARFRRRGAHGIAEAVLAVDGRGWRLATAVKDGIDVHVCDLSDTLLLELAEDVSYGRLKIDYASNGRQRECAVEFNTIDSKLYRSAIDMILDGIERPPLLSFEEEAERATRDWPFTLQSLALDYADGRGVRAAVHWPAIRNSLDRETAPAGALLLTERQLLIITEALQPSSKERGPADESVGAVATYCPLARLLDFRVATRPNSAVITLSMQAAHGGANVELTAPQEIADRAGALLEQAIRRTIS